MDSYTQGFERSYAVNSSILHGIEPRLKDFHQLLLRPPKVQPALLGASSTGTHGWEILQLRPAGVGQQEPTAIIFSRSLRVLFREVFGTRGMEMGRDGEEGTFSI